MAPKLCWPRRYKSRLVGWQPRGLAVALALVVLDLDFHFDLLRLVGEIVGILQRLVVRLQVRGLLEAGLLDLLGLGEGELGGGCHRRGCGSRRGCCRGAAAPDLHEVLAIVLPAALGAFDRTFVQVIEARCTILAGAL